MTLFLADFLHSQAVIKSLILCSFLGEAQLHVNSINDSMLKKDSEMEGPSTFSNARGTPKVLKDLTMVSRFV